MADRVDAELDQLLEEVSGAQAVSEDSAAHLGLMLQGFNLYLDPNGQEPYLEIYYAAVSRDCLEELARVAEALLLRWLEGRWKARLEKRAHFNLLGLCREVHDRQRLGKPIWELYRRREEKLVWGEYDMLKPVPLVGALLDAMIRNQPDSAEPETLWRNLLDGVLDGYLEAGPLDGFVGMLYLPGGDRVALLTEALRKLFWMDQEWMFLGALSKMKRAVPHLVASVDTETKKRISEDFLTVIDGRRVCVVEPAIDRSRAKGEYAVVSGIQSRWSNVVDRFKNELARVEKSSQFPTKIQVYDSYTQLINREFYEELDPIKPSPFRTIGLQLRTVDSARRPNPSNPDLSLEGASTLAALPIESGRDLENLFA